MKRGVFKTAFGKVRQSAEALIEGNGSQLTFLSAAVLITLVMAVAYAMNSFAGITEDSMTNAAQSYQVLVEQKTQSEQEANLPALNDSSSTTTVTTESRSSSSSVRASSSSDTTAEVIVNGKQIAVPEQGSTQTEIETDEGTMQVEISVDSESTSVDSSDSSIDIDIDSTSEVRENGGD